MPSAQSLPYSQDFSALAAASTTYPVGWQGWTVSAAPAATYSTAGPTADQALTASGSASSTAGAVYNYNGKIGYLNTGTLDATVVLALNTSGFSSTKITYDVMTLRNLQDGSNTRINEVSPQYRVGTSGAWTTITGAEYQNNTATQTTGTTPQNSVTKSIMLPAACDNQAVVQVRWASRQVSGAGSRPSFAVDNISAIPAPTATPASGISLNSFSANWNALSGASGYRLDVATDSSFTSLVSGFNNLDVGNVTTKAVTGLSPSTTYYYRLRAYNSLAATSGNSATITVATSLLIFDQFNYSTGDINNANGGSGWGTVWYNCGGTSAGMVQSPGMSYLANNLSVNAAGNYIHSDAAKVAYRRLSQFYGNSCALGGSSIWITFLGRATFCNFNGFFGLSLFDSPAGDGCASAEKFFIGKRGGQNCFWGMQRTGGAGAESSVAFDGSTRLIVVRIDFPGSGNNSARMWVDPAMTGTPSDASAAITLTGLADMCWDRVRITSSAASFGNDAAGDIDELRFGSTFCDAISLMSPSVTVSPNPGSTTCAGTSVTFTATPGNAGNTPSYQWKKNGNAVGSNSSAYTDAALANNDSITCTVTSSGCGAAQTTSAAIIMTVNPIPNSTITAPSSVCPSSVGNTASVPTTPGASYDWTISGGSITAGAGTSSITFSANASGSVVLNCTVTASGCSSGGSQNTTIAISSPDSTVTAATSVCANSTGNLASVPTAPGATYTWTIGGGTITAGAGTRQITFTADASGSVILNCTVAVGSCSSGGSQNITIAIIPVPNSPGPIAQGNPGGSSVCAGSTAVTYSVASVSGATSYTWAVPSGAAITAGQTTTSITVNWGTAASGNVTVTANNSCGSSAPSSLGVTVNPNVTPSVSVTANPPSPICSGTPVLFTATPANGGASPTYVWKKNGGIVSGTGNTYSDSGLVNGDVINVVMTPSSDVCASAATATSSSLTMSVNTFRLVAATALSENMGTTSSGNPSVNTFAGWQNSSPITFASTTSLTPDVRTTTASSGYPGASAGNNVFFTTTTGARNFLISGINTLGLNSIQLQFGLKADAIVSGDPFVVEVSSDGTTYSPLTVPQPNSTTSWVLTTASGSIPTTANLRIRFSKNTTSSWRLDDVKVQSVASTAAITASGPTTICAGDSVTLTATAGGSAYAWSSSQTTPAITVSPAITTTYTVTITDANGCTSTANQTITINPLPNITITAPPRVCAGSTGHTASVPDGGPGYTYAWSIAGGTITAGGSSSSITFDAGLGSSLDLSVVVTTPASCSATGLATLIIDPQVAAPGISVPSALTEGHSYIASVISHAGATYQWSIANGTISSDPQASSISFVAGTPGSLNLSVTEANAAGDCSASSSVSIAVYLQPQPPFITAPTTVCSFASGYSASVPSRAGMTYMWTLNNGHITPPPTGPSITFEATTAGTMTLAVVESNPAGDSASSAPFDITVNPRPAAVASGNATICHGSTTIIQAALTGTGPWNVTWSDGFMQTAASSPATRNISPSSTTTYSVAVLTDANCTAQPGDLSGSALITVNPQPTASVSGDATICDGALTTIEAALTGTGPWNVTWSDGFMQTAASSPATRSVSPSSTTTYSVAGLTDANCTAHVGDLSGSALITVNPRPTAFVSGSATTCPGVATPIQAALTGTGPWSITWSDGFVQTVGSSPANRNVSPMSPTTYTVTGLADAHCSAQAGDLSGSASINAHDNVSPIVTAGSIATCYTNQTSAEAAAIAATSVSDNCDTHPNVTAGTVGSCNATITVTATDASGNFASVQYITRIVAPPAFTTVTATEGALNVKNCANTTVQGTVSISVTVAAACGLVGGQPGISLVNGSTLETATFDNESPAGTFNYHWDVTAGTLNGTWTATVTASDVCQSSTTQFALCMNNAQLSGNVELENFVGTGSAVPHSRVITFIATDDPGTNANILKSWTLSVTNTSGGTFAFVLTDVPLNTRGLSAKTAWNLRSKVPVLADPDGHLTVSDLIGPKRLRGGDFDGNNIITFSDYSVLALHFFTYDPTADITGDGDVDFDDYEALANNWLTHGDPE